MKRTCILRCAIGSRKKRYVFVHLNQLKLHMYHQVLLTHKKYEPLSVMENSEKTEREQLKFLLLNLTHKTTAYLC